MAEQAEETGGAVRRSVTVTAPPERAFQTFTGGIGRWWPLDTYKIGAVAATEAVIEPREGGRWFERGEDGSESDWGRVLAWEPPGRLVLAWQIGADWRYDPSLETEVEILFTATPDGGTEVTLEHRGLDAYGGRAAEMTGVFASSGGWTALLERYANEAA
jgi:uncharacterized protein YndB with AHSA1/START domain